MNATDLESPLRLRRAPVATPVVFTVLGIAAVAYIVGPIIALGLRVPWGRFVEIAARAETREMLIITLAAAAQATVIAVALGVGLAVWLHNLRRGASIVRLLVYVPLAMPPVVAGLALTAAFGRRGLLAPILDALGIQFAFDFSGVVLAHIFVALPFVVVAVDTALRQIDGEILASARGIGLTQWQILGKITAPMTAPAILTGAALAFARSLGEFGTTITFAGSMPGITRTMPLGIYLEREVSTENAYVLSAILIALAIVSLAVAGLPTLVRKTPRQRARELGCLDSARLRELTAPDSAAAVTVSHGDHTTVFPAGTISAIIGENGAGKTTLMNIIAGRVRADVTVDAGGGRVVMLTQRPGLPPTTTALGAVAMVVGREKAAQMLDAAGLADVADARVPTLSGGQAAQVALVRALAARPAVLILDEPLAAVDVASAARWRRFLHATAHDRTTLMVTHNALDVAGLSSFAAVLEGGQVVTAGPTDTLLRTPPTPFVAGLAGLGMLRVTVTSTDEVVCAGTRLHVDTDGLPEGAAALATFRPTAANIVDSDDGLAGKVIAVTATTLADATASVDLGAGVVDVPIDAATADALTPGMSVRCQIPASELKIYAATS